MRPGLPKVDPAVSIASWRFTRGSPMVHLQVHQGTNTVADENKLKMLLLSKIAKSAMGLTVGIVILMPSLAMAQPLDRDKAQGDMLLRVSRSVGAFAAQIGLPKLYVTYCFTKLNLSRKNLPVDGDIPYGVYYNTANDETVRLTLSSREEYETGYLMICLAEAKNAISAASKQE
jgi:hypothetical protein